MALSQQKAATFRAISLVDTSPEPLLLLVVPHLASLSPLPLLPPVFLLQWTLTSIQLGVIMNGVWLHNQEPQPPANRRCYGAGNVYYFTGWIL